MRCKVISLRHLGSIRIIVFRFLTASVRHIDFWHYYARVQGNELLRQRTYPQRWGIRESLQMDLGLFCVAFQVVHFYGEGLLSIMRQTPSMDG